MRTSYQREKNGVENQKKNLDYGNSGSVRDNTNLEEEILRISLREAYIQIDEAVTENRKRQEVREYSEALEAQAEKAIRGDMGSEYDGYEDNGEFRRGENEEGYDDDYPDGVEPIDEDEIRHKKMRKRVILGCTAASLVVVGVAGLFVYKNFFAPDSSVEAIQTRISKLYTSESMVDIKDSVTQADLDSFYLELLDVQGKGDDVDSAMEELDTIGYFLSDKSKLERYNSDSYDLTTAGMMDSIEDIKDNASGYSVPGLALTINDLAGNVEEDYDYFIELRTELNGVVDALTFDEFAWDSKIDLVSHIPNRTELEATYDKIVVDKQAAEAQKKLQEAEDEQAKLEAQKALEEAQKLQRQTQQELEDTKKQLEEAAKKAAEAEKRGEPLDASPVEPTEEVDDETGEKPDGGEGTEEPVTESGSNVESDSGLDDGIEPQSLSN